VARSYGLERVELLLDQDSLQHCLQGYVDALEDLRMGMGYPVYLTARRVSRDAKVVLSGTGGDEFHAGYVGRYQALAAGGSAGWWQRLKRCLRPAAPRTFEAIYRSMLNFMIKTTEHGQVFTPEFLTQANGFDADAVISDLLAQCPSSDWRDQVMYVDARTYLAGLLNFEDKVSMAHGLETRVPLLDNELVDFVLDVPFDALWQGDTGKILFRETVRPWVPEEIYRKPKMGFGPPDASWYRGRLRPWIEEMLAPRTVAARGVFQPAFVAATLNDHFAGRRDATYLIWSWLNFEAWCRQFGFFGARAEAERLAG
jgi:asparagine synthase (glutamine-hydrolysing)